MNFDPIKTIEPIVDFYLDANPLRDDLGFTFKDVMQFTDEQLETQHDYIQWMFPIREASQFNPYAPLVTNHTILLFRELDILRDRMFESYEKMKSFYFTRGRCWDWVTPNNHNFLRITRIIKSLKLFGLEQQAHDFYAWCQVVIKHTDYIKIIGEETQKYWKEAIEND